jgi:predicted RNase H-like HicB family nuclease
MREAITALCRRYGAGLRTQAPTLEEARADVGEAVELALEANRVLAEERLGGR